MTLSVLGSSSEGNATLIATPKTRILIDAGRGPVQLRKAMDSIGYDATDLDGIFLSHEHGDHAGKAEAISRKAGLCPIFATRWTQEVEWKPSVKKPSDMEILQIGQETHVGDISVTPFSIPHDAADPVAFRVSHSGVHAVVLLDCGYMTAKINDWLRDCAAVVIDSNYDEALLQYCNRPEFVKERVASTLGHMSNCQVAEWITGLWDGQSHHLVLAHLSRDNNTPTLAHESARQAVAERGLGTNIVTAIRNEPTTPLHL